MIVGGLMEELAELTVYLEHTVGVDIKEKYNLTNEKFSYLLNKYRNHSPKPTTVAIQADLKPIH
jgi:hypothetical protein